MQLFCCYTPAHEILFKEYFLPTVPAGFNVRATVVDLSGAGDFMSGEYVQCICRKIELVIESIHANEGEVIAWSDIDIQFFDLTPERLRADLGDCDLAYQREARSGAEVNGGFFVCRCNPHVRQFYETILEELRKNPKTHDQNVINHRIFKQEDLGISLGFLPNAYYSRTHGWPPPRDLVSYHANSTLGKDAITSKIRQFRELGFVRRFGLLAIFLTSIKYAPKRIRRLLSTAFQRARG